MKIHQINLGTEIKEKLFHLAIGNFDGVHIGHQKIIKELVKKAKNNNPSAVLSFSPHPRKFFSNNIVPNQIISESNKQKLLESLGIDHYFLLNFDNSIANLSPSDFLENIVVNQLKVSKLLVGYDFRFGKDRRGDISLIRDFSNVHGFEVKIIDPIKRQSTDEIYSSTLIREAITNGDMEKANILLGHNWVMEGNVVHGDKRARQMSFPTANIIPHELILPLKGVYAIKTSINDQIFNGIANYGERPTVQGKKLLLEVHLFDFEQNIYGKHLTVEFLTFMRSEKKFDSFTLLVEQIKIDIECARNYHLNK